LTFVRERLFARPARCQGFRQITEHLPGWSMAPVATAIQAMPGVALINAVTIVAEVGDFSRFGNPRQLMAYLGLVPSARRALIEGAGPI
jgi:transposase